MAEDVREQGAERGIWV